MKYCDHRKLNKQLDLYHIQEESPGMIFWHNSGLIIMHELKKFIRMQLKKYDYQEVKSPLMLNYKLWEITGHWENYSEHIFSTTSENKTYCIKPMNCPGHVQIFNQGLKSYKDLPIRLAEFGNCHRNEPSGSLHGLMRTQGFIQDDAHIFCAENHIEDEIKNCIKMMSYTYNVFGFKNIKVKLSTRPKKRIGSDITWDLSEQYLSNILHELGINFKYKKFDGAFYGPKIEFTLLDSLGRNWQCGTVQLDFSLPKRLNAFYINNKNERNIPIMIHRAILGSIERFIAILTEEYNGFYPTWLAPIQVVLVNINNQQIKYILELAKKLSKANIRVKIDIRNEKIGFKIREHTLCRIPYMLICGNEEMNANEVAVRTFHGKQLGRYNIDTFIQKLKLEICNHDLHQLKGE